MKQSARQVIDMPDDPQRNILKTRDQEPSVEDLLDDLDLLKASLNRNQRHDETQLKSVQATVGVAKRTGLGLVPHRMFWDGHGKLIRTDYRNDKGQDAGYMTIEWFTTDEDEVRFREVEFNITGQTRATLLFYWDADADADWVLNRVELRRMA